MSAGRTLRPKAWRIAPWHHRRPQSRHIAKRSQAHTNPSDQGGVCALKASANSTAPRLCQLSADPLVLIAVGYVADAFGQLQKHVTFIIQEDEHGSADTAYKAEKECAHNV